MSKPIINTTYGKRRRNKKENVPSVNRGVDNQSDNNHKRTDHSEQAFPENQPLQKKRKFFAEGVDVCALIFYLLIVDLTQTLILVKNQGDMALQSFQTPFPTLQAQSQIFRLPSSRPQETPGILSPVPVSSGLKENKNKKRSSANKSSWYSGKLADSCVVFVSVISKSTNFVLQNYPDIWCLRSYRRNPPNVFVSLTQTSR